MPSCTSPIPRQEFGTNQYGNRNFIGKTDPNFDHDPKAPTFPFRCRKCISCLLAHEADWATRLMDEYAYSDHAVFTTHTYSPEHLPQYHGFNYKHWQDFMKRLRKHFGERNKNGKPIRFYCVEEYGAPSLANDFIGRPHMHAIIFNAPFHDFQHLFTKDGHINYTSSTLTKLWGKGHTSFGSVTPQSCAYVAGYLKDSSIKKGGTQTYDYVDIRTGEYIERPKPQSRSSRNPGIGYEFAMNYLYDMFPKDSRHNKKGKSVPISKYYLDILKDDDPTMFSHVIDKRIEYALSDRAQYDATPARRKTLDELRTINFPGQRHQFND